MVGGEKEMIINGIFKNKKIISIFCILLGIIYYICFFGKLFYYIGLRFLDIFDLVFEGLTLATAINPAIIPFWGVYESTMNNLPDWFFFLNYLIIMFPPSFLLIGGIGLLKGKNWARKILITYGVFWTLSALLTITLIIRG